MRDELGERVASVIKHFYLPRSDNFFDHLTRVVESSPSQIATLAENFLSGMRAAVSVASMPYMMVATSLHEQYLQALYTQQRILSFAEQIDRRLSDEERDRWADERTKEIAESENRDPDPQKIEKGGLRILAELEKLLSSDFRVCADELLRQSIVLVWGVFEVLASDLFMAILNSDPQKTSLLLSDPRTRKYYQPKEFGTALEKHSYDLSGCMGDVLLQQRRVDDVVTIRDLYEVLFPCDERLRSILADIRLWQLGQDRNLIVHRRAIVDVRYVENTGSQVQIGSILFISRLQLNGYIEYVRDAGSELLRAASCVVS